MTSKPVDYLRSLLAAAVIQHGTKTTEGWELTLKNTTLAHGKLDLSADTDENTLKLQFREDE